jgi:hypothetical protein
VQVEAASSAAGPLAVGFALSVLSLPLVIGGGVLAARNDDWLLLVIPGVVVFVVGVLKLAEGIHSAVRSWERALARR